MNKNYVIYKVTNKINNKIYIGKTYDFKKRKRCHLNDINNGLPFHNALKKYGIDNFEWEIIDKASTDSEIREKEIAWIKKYNTCIAFPNSNGYNLTLGGEGGISWNSKAVLQYDLNGYYIDEYVSASHAEHVTGVGRKQIAECAKGELKRAGQYMWRYKDDDFSEKIQPYSRAESTRKRAVMQIDKKGNIVNTFDSLKMASEYTNTSRTCISACLNGTIGLANGFLWIYVEDYNFNYDYKYRGIKEGKGIYQLDENKNIINHFNNCTEAVRALNEPDKVHKQIWKATKTGNKCRGFYWIKAV